MTPAMQYEALRDSLDKLPHGVKLLRDPVRNKGTAFTEAERDALGLRGLLPPRVHTHAEQVMRVLHRWRTHSGPGRPGG